MNDAYIRWDWGRGSPPHITSSHHILYMASGEDKERKGERGEKEEGRKREEGKAGTLSYEGTDGENRGWLTRPCKRAGSSSAGKPAGQRRRGGREGERGRERKRKA